MAPMTVIRLSRLNLAASLFAVPSLYGDVLAALFAGKHAASSSFAAVLDDLKWLVATDAYFTGGNTIAEFADRAVSGVWSLKG